MPSPQLIAAFIATGCIAFLVSLLLSKLAIRLGTQFNIVAVPGGRRKHARNTPKLGAIPLFGAFAVAVLISQQFGIGTEDLNEGRRLMGLLIGSAVIFITGLLDDKFNLSPPIQFAAQGVSALIAIASLIFIERFTNPFASGPNALVVVPDVLDSVSQFASLSAIVLISLFWFIGMMNTVNWLDGVDGLAATVGLIAAAVTMIHMLREGQYSVALLPTALIGALLGFLVFNFQPARIFMSGGALWLGFALACIGIIGGAKIALLLLVMGVPIADVIWQMFDRWRHGRSPAASDRGHLHFRLTDSGWPPWRIVTLYAAVCAGFGAVALVPQPPLFKLITLLVLFLAVVAALLIMSRQPHTTEGDLDSADAKP